MNDERSLWRAWLCRIYVVVVVVAWNVTMATDLLGPIADAAFFVLLPLLLPAIFLTFSLCAFKLDFSAFGRRDRTPWPASPVLVSAAYSGGSIGWLNATAPFMSWLVFAEGVGVRVLGVGAGFVPLSAIERVQPHVFFGGCKVFHRSTEVRSPLDIPSAEIHATLARIAARPSGVRTEVVPVIAECGLVDG